MHLLSVSEKILFLLCGLGIVQGILLAALIYFHPKSDRSVNIFLAFYILCTSAIMSMPFFIKLIGWRDSFFLQPIPLLTGPLLYLYLRSFKEKLTWRKVAPHFLLAIAVLFFTYWNVVTVGAKYVNVKELPEEVLHRPTTIMLQYLKPVQEIIYFFLSRKVLLSYQRSIRQLYSETSRIDLSWGKHLVYGYLTLVCVFLVILPLMLRFHEWFDILLLINMVIATPYIYITTYKGVMQHTIWQMQPDTGKQHIVAEINDAEKLEAVANQPQKQVTEKAGLHHEKIDSLVQQIVVLMEREKLYQETELTLQQLAARLDVPTYQVSQALNEGLKKNFYDVVNGYRVEEAKRLLLDARNKNYTILSVGFEAGFNSKTTFNTVFKKFTGLTPTEFRGRDPKPAITAAIA